MPKPETSKNIAPESSGSEQAAGGKELSGTSVTADECGRVLRAVPILREFSDDDVAALCVHLQAHELLPGATLFYEDDDSDAVYFLASGSIEIFKSDQTGKKLPLIILRDKGLLGEIGLLNDSPRSATARALGAARVLCFPKGAFNQALDDGSVPVHRLVLAFARILSQRLSSMNNKLFELFENETDNAASFEANEFKQRLLSTWTSLSVDPHGF